MNYRPIDCSFHDLLLDRASRKVECDLIYRDGSNQSLYKGKILDVYSDYGKEYLKGEKDFEIQLDKIISLDGINAFRANSNWSS